MNHNQLARTYFKLELPVTSVELKKAYRQRCLELHPDVGGDEREFMEMQAAYATLTSSGYVEQLFSKEKEFKETKTTMDGTPLAELGLGLGAENGTDCPECGHRGYVKFEPSAYMECTTCKGIGLEPGIETCSACRGTGKFTQERSRRVVTCRVCQGRGFTRKPALWSNLTEVCSKCRGIGRILRPTGAVQYVKCRKCEGKGEIPMWNPVLRKAALGGS